MNNKFIYSNKLNTTEFIRSLSRYGINCFGVAVFNMTSLCDEINSKLGMPITDEFLCENKIKLLTCNSIFDPAGFQFYQDISNTVNTIGEVGKYLDVSDPLKDFNKRIVGNFPDDNNIKALNEWLTAYISFIKHKHVLDENSYAREVIKLLDKPVFEEIFILENDYLTPIELILLNKCSKRVVKTSIFELFSLQPKQRVVSQIIGGYGERNEIEKIISNIFKNKYPLDTVSILVTDPIIYAHYLFELSKEYNIPMTFKCGVPITLSNPFKIYIYLIVLLCGEAYSWKFYNELFDEKYFDCKKFFGCEDFESIKKVFCLLSFSFSKHQENLQKYNDLCNNAAFRDFFFKLIDRKIDINVALGQIKNAIAELQLPPAEFVEKYYIHRDNLEDKKLDECAMQEIRNTFINSNFLINKTKETYLEQLIDSLVMKNGSKEGAIFVGDITSGFSTIRKHTYIAGLSANNFPKKQNENYILSNRAFRQLAPDENRHNETKQLNEQVDMQTLLSLLTSLNSRITLSYSYQNLVDVKENNPSSIIFDVAPEVKDFSLKKLRECGSYFDSDISPLKNLALAKKNMTPIKHIESDVKQTPDNTNYLDKVYSPSTLDKFLKCPLQFYLSQIAKFNDDELTRSVDPLSFGNIVHFVVEHQATFQKSSEGLDEYINEFFSFLKNTCFDVDKYGYELDDLVESSKNAVSVLDEYYPIEAEYAFPITEIFGVKFKGTIDLLAKKNNKYYIIDYKTGKNVNHVENDFNSCIQTIIYAFMLKEYKNIEVEACIYVYTRTNERVFYMHPLEAKEQLKATMDMFISAIKEKNFTLNLPDKSSSLCKYCDFKGVCPNNGK